MLWYIPAILALGLLIIVHEGGHFIVARLCKMRVERFSLFFGPALFKFKRGDTTYQIGSIPLGGFVQISGMNPHEEVDENDPHVYPNRPTWQRALTIFAGPGTNYLFAVVLWFVLQAVAGTGVPVVLGVEPGMAAARAGLEPGDTVTAVEGKRLSHSQFQAFVSKSGGRPIQMDVARPARDFRATVPAFRDEASGLWRIGLVPGPAGPIDDLVQATTGMSRLDAIEAWTIASLGLRSDDTLRLGDGRSAPLNDPAALSKLLEVGAGQAIAVTVHRAGSQFPVTLTPSYDGNLKRYRIGIGLAESADRRVKPGLGLAAMAAVRYPYDQSKEILTGLYLVVTRKEKGEVGGPVKITKFIKQSFQFGWAEAVRLLAVLNVYLGLFNLLPLPALDGGRLVFLGYEMVTRRRPNPRFEAAVHMVGFMVLFGLMILVTFKDIFM